MTALPIDYRKAPYKHKYLDEETPMLNRWFVWGGYPDGTVAICDKDNDVMIHVPHDIAYAIVKARNEFVDVIIEHLGMK